MKIRIRHFDFICGCCGRTYRAPLSASSYGCLVFWDGTGHCQAAVDAVGDQLFEKVRGAVSGHPAAVSVTARRRGEVIQRVVARLSDAAPTGEGYDPAAKPACPHCGMSRPREWRSVEPPEIIEVDLPVLERRAWDRRPPDEQAALLAIHVSEALTE